MATVLRMAPTCYHVLHQVPATIAHEMSFFFDEGLRTADGQRGYEVVPEGLCPFGLERLGMWQAHLEKDVPILLDVKPQSVFYAREHCDADLFIVAGWRNQQTGGWVARPEVDSIADLAGKTVGIIDFGGISHSAFKGRLRAAGLDPEDVNWIRGVSPPHNLEYLRAGKVDCTLFQRPQVPALEAEGFRPVQYMKDNFPGGRADRVLAVSGEMVRSRTEELCAFLRGLLRAYWFIRNQPVNYRYLTALEKRMRLDTVSPSERKRISFYSPEAAEDMPFPIDGVATGFQYSFEDAIQNGELEGPPGDAEMAAVCRFEFVKQAYEDLRNKPEVQEDLAAATAVAEQLGY